MNVQTHAAVQSQIHATLSTRQQRPARDRARDFGVGYGNSSGYASARRYLGSQPAPRFRCA
jgi:hypothetical protein